MRSQVALATAFATLALSSPAAGASLNVDFGTSYGTPSSGYGAASGQTGVWNEVGLGVAALVDVTGAASGASISVTATALGNTTSDGGDDARLLADNFYVPNSNWSADLSGLAPGGYRVFLYAPSNGSVPTGTMTVAGTALASLPGDPDSGLVEATSWDDVLVSTSDGTLAISGGGGVFTGLAGLQIVPEPVCADGVLEGTEECEDGGTESGDGCYATCHFEGELVLTGSAAGGSASVSIFGRLLTTSTSAGQSATTVIAALTAVVNADAILAGLGVSAVAIGNRLVTNGSIDGADLADPGLAQCGVSVPTSSSPGLALLAFSLVAVGSWAALTRRWRVMRRLWRAPMLGIVAGAALVLAETPVAGQGACTVHPSGEVNGLGEAILIDFGVNSTVVTVFAVVQEDMLRPWVVDEFALDITITSLDGIDHFHGTDVIPLSQGTIVDQEGELLTLEIAWSVDDEPQVIGDVYTVCAQLVAGGPVAPERCTIFGPFF